MSREGKELVKYTDEQLAMARDAYMEGETYDRIAALSGLKVSAVRYYVNKHWYQEREEQALMLAQHFVGSKKKLLNDISQRGLNILRHSLKKWQEENYVLSPKEAGNVVNILMNFDKIARLDSGNATEITAVKESNKHVTMIEVDPLHPDNNKQIEEVEVVRESE